MKLYIVATPIGNLEDITYRAIKTFKEVDIILAEDTRHSQILLNKYDIKKKVISYHSHSGQMKVGKIIEYLKEGKTCALISDAGTPGISDPAYGLVQAALEIGAEIIPIPGPSAFLAALSASGLPVHHFIYLGFLPIKKGRQTLINSFKEEDRTIVFYESPHRIQKTIKQLNEVLGDERYIVIAREITKIHEEYIRGTISEIRKDIESRNPKGEYTVIIAGAKYKQRD